MPDSSAGCSHSPPSGHPGRGELTKSYPYFRWWVADAETDEAYSSLSDPELGFFHRLLNRAWVNDGLPVDLDTLAASFRVSRKYLDKMWVRVGPLFPEDGATPARRRNKRQEAERENCFKKSLAAAKGGSEKATRKSQGIKESALRQQNERSTEGVLPVRARADSDSGSSSLGFQGGAGGNSRAPENGAVESDFADAVERMYALHPKKKDLVLIPQSLERAGNRLAIAEIEAAHSAWCEHEDWRKENGRYCPSLAKWLDDRGYERMPVAPIPIRRAGSDFVADVTEVIQGRIAKGEKPW